MEAPSAFQETIFEQGHEVGRLAHQLFPGGVLVEEDHTKSREALERTSELLKDGAPAIFEAAFLFDNILVRADIISRSRDGSWDLFEVKSTCSIKKQHLDDCAIQKFVLTNAGLPLSSTNLVHLNNEYRRTGGIDVSGLFRRTQVDEDIEKNLKAVPSYLAKIRDALALENEPAATIGSICKSPYPCEFKLYCWLGVEPDSIHFLSRISDSKRLELLQSAIEKIKDVPDDIALTELQFVQVKVEREGKASIERDKIRKFIGTLQYPLFFLDFETYGFAIPQYDGTRPYEQLPFQFSLHVQDAPGAPLRHVEFLHGEASDPRRALAEALVGSIGSAGSVVAYHASFEKGRIEELVDLFPDLAPRLQSMCDRLWDLEVPFAKKWYYDSRFQGSSSIKKVLPALTSLSYDGLEIAKGDVAQMRYMQMIAMSHEDPARETIRKNLLLYCGQDSLAMVRLLETLQSL